MAIKKYQVTINPEPYTVTIEASKPQGAVNKAHRQWRDEVAKKVEKLDIAVDRVKEGVTVHSETEGEEQTEELS